MFEQLNVLHSDLKGRIHDLNWLTFTFGFIYGIYIQLEIYSLHTYPLPLQKFKTKCRSVTLLQPITDLTFQRSQITPNLEIPTPVESHGEQTLCSKDKGHIMLVGRIILK